MGIDDERPASQASGEQGDDPRGQHEVSLDSVERAASDGRAPRHPEVPPPGGQVVSVRRDDRAGQRRVVEALADERAGGGPVGRRVPGGDHQQAHRPEP
jgi:hypothetical protein